MAEDQYPPQHMTLHHRNERLYKTLLGMGLIVYPKVVDGQIESLWVSADLPLQDSAQNAAKAGIGAPMQGAQVGQGVHTTKGVGDNVVDFPPVF